MIDNLKIKAAKQALEAKLIRKEEKRFKTNFRWHSGNYGQSRKHRKDQEPPELYVYKKEYGDEAAKRLAEDEFTGRYIHRTRALRAQARITHLARMFIRGRPYHEVENKTHSDKQFFEDLRPVDEKSMEKGRYGAEPRMFHRIRKEARSSWPIDVRDFEQKWAQWVEDAKKHLGFEIAM